MSGRTARKGRTSSSGLDLIRVPQFHESHGEGRWSTPDLQLSIDGQGVC